MSRISQDELDMRVLVHRADFRRFLLHVSRAAGIWIPTSGADQSLPFREGQRSLGLEILRHAACGLPRGGTPEQMLSVVLSESTPKETTDAPEDDSETDDYRR